MGKPGQYVLLLLSLCWVCAARIEHATIDRDSRQLIPLSNSFGFGAEGHLGITVSHILVHAVAKPNLSDFGFFLTTTPNDLIEMLQIDPSLCFLRETTDYNVEVLATFMSPGLVSLVNNGTGSYENSTAIGPGRGGEYSLFFESCADVDSVVVSFKVRTEMYNVNAAGKRDYLSAGEAELPTVFLVMALLFTLAAAGWAYLVWIERENAQKIHYLMFLLVVLKILTLFSQAAMYHYIRAKGTPDGWNIAFYIFTFLRGIMFFSVVVLIGTGWSYMKPFLGDHEKKILMVVIPLQVFANVAIIILDENTPADRAWLTWLDIFHLVDIICCCAVLFPIVWSIKHLREAAQTDGKAARNMMKLTLFRQFYVMVVIYIYFTRIVVFLLRSTLPYKYTWWSFAANELATLVFYVLTALKFKPHKENPYLKIEAEEDEGQEML